MKTRWISITAALISLISGCQCCPLFDHYANVVDDVNDTHVYFDRLYNPKLDITRMGKPDWCSPVNRLFCRRCCLYGYYDGYDDCNLYPPITTYNFPSHVLPPPTIRTKRVERRLDVEMGQEFDDMLADPRSGSSATDAVPAPVAAPPPAPAPGQ